MTPRAALPSVGPSVVLLSQLHTAHSLLPVASDIHPLGSLYFITGDASKKAAIKPLRHNILLYSSKSKPPVELGGIVTKATIKLTGHYYGNLSISPGSGRRIRTLTYGVRVRCATFTQSRCVHHEQFLLYTILSNCQYQISKIFKIFLMERRRAGRLSAEALKNFHKTEVDKRLPLC